MIHTSRPVFTASMRSSLACLLVLVAIAPTPGRAQVAAVFAPERSGPVQGINPTPIEGSLPALPAWQATRVDAEPVSTASVLPPPRPAPPANPQGTVDRPRLPELRMSLRLGRGRPDTMTTGSVSPSTASPGPRAVHEASVGARLAGARFPVGTWAPEEASCDALASSGYLPVLIGSTKATAGEATCRYKSTERAGQGWRVTAVCSDGAATWRSNIRLAQSAGTLRWSSERGTATYRRCAPEDVGATGVQAGPVPSRTGKITKG
jgi:hypothetical protein